MPADKKSRFGARLIKSFRECAIVHALTKFATFIYNAVSTSVFAKIMTSYGSGEQTAHDSLSGTLLHSGGSEESEFFRKVKHGFAASLEHSALLSFIKKFGVGLLLAPMAAYGVLFFSFGFYVSVIYLLKKYTFSSIEPDLNSLILGVVLIAVSFAFFISKKSLAQAVSESRILRFVLFDVLRLSSGTLDNSVAQPMRSGINISFIAGMVLGLISMLVNPMYIAIALIAMLAMTAVISSPEAGIITVCLTLPFLPTMALVALMALIIFSCVIKFLCGKRVIKTSLIDVPVALFMILTIFGGIFSKSGESMEKMLVMVCFMFAYFIIKNLIRSAALLRKCLSCIAFSGAAVAIYGIVENYIGSPSTIWQDTAQFGEIKGRVVSTFANPNVLGEYLIIIIPITAALAITARAANERFALSCAGAFEIFCLVLTWSRGAWLGFIISTLFFLLIYSRHFLTAGILLTPAAVLGLTFAGGSVVRRITSIFTASDTSSSYRLGIWRGTLRMLSDVFPYGIGIGEGAFKEVYPAYALRGIETAPHSHNLYLQITTELGIVGIAVFLIFIFLYLQMNFTYITSAIMKNNRTIALGIFCGIIAFLLAGVTDYVFYNYRVFLFFWICVGLSSAEIAMSKNIRGESNDFFY